MERNQEGKPESPQPEEGDKLPPQPKFRPFEKVANGRMHTLTIYTYFSTMRVTNACPGKIQEFQIRKGLLLRAEGGISWWMDRAKLHTPCPQSGPRVCFYRCMRLVWPGLVYLGTVSEFILCLKPFLLIASELWEQHFQSPSDVLLLLWSSYYELLMTCYLHTFN